MASVISAICVEWFEVKLDTQTRLFIRIWFPFLKSKPTMNGPDTVLVVLSIGTGPEKVLRVLLGNSLGNNAGGVVTPSQSLRTATPRN